MRQIFSINWKSRLSLKERPYYPQIYVKVQLRQLMETRKVELLFKELTKRRRLSIRCNTPFTAARPKEK